MIARLALAGCGLAVVTRLAFAPVGVHYVTTPDQRAQLVVALNVYYDNGDPGNTLYYRDGSSAPIASTVFATPDGVTHHTSGWLQFTLAQLGVPADATSVDLGIKSVLTKGPVQEDAYVALFAAAHGDGPTVCPGGYPAETGYPIAANMGSPVNCMVALTIARTAGDGQRGFNQVTVPVNGGGLDLAYDYQRVAGSGDALGCAVYLNGYTR